MNLEALSNNEELHTFQDETLNFDQGLDSNRLLTHTSEVPPEIYVSKIDHDGRHHFSQEDLPIGFASFGGYNRKEERIKTQIT